jgi:hypothetical protein
VAALSRKPSGVRGDEFAFLGFNSSIVLFFIFYSLSLYVFCLEYDYIHEGGDSW